MAGESRLQTRCRELAEKYGVIVRKIKAEGHNGWPDLLLLFPCGAVVFVEMKNPNKNGRLHDAQIREQNKILKNNGIVYTCDQLSDFKRIIKRHLK